MTAAITFIVTVRTKNLIGKNFACEYCSPSCHLRRLLPFFFRRRRRRQEKQCSALLIVCLHFVHLAMF
jgi:hypothetical protein